MNNIFETDGYIQKLRDNCVLVENSIYYDNIINSFILDDTVITLAVEQAWFGKRGVFDKLSNLVFYYGLWDSGHSFTFNSETTFHEFCKHNNIYHIGIQEKQWPVYFNSIEDSKRYLFGICRM